MSGLCERPQTRRGDREDDQAGDEDPPAPDQVRDGPGGEQEGGQREGVRVDDPLQVLEARVQRPLDVGQRDIHDRDVEQQHEDRDRDGEQSPPLAIHVPAPPLLRRRPLAPRDLPSHITKPGDPSQAAEASFLASGGHSAGLRSWSAVSPQPAWRTAASRGPRSRPGRRPGRGRPNRRRGAVSGEARARRPSLT